MTSYMLLVERIAALKAEIERKDKAIELALDYLSDAYVGSAKITLSKALSTNEDSDDS